MEVFFEYLLKSSCLVLLFLVVYQLFLKKETFFAENRLFLIIGLVISSILPFVTITKTVMLEPMTINYGTFSVISETDQTASAFEWFYLLVTVYVLGVSFFTFRLINQLLAIKKIKQQSQIVIEEPIVHVKTLKEISPFSFFHHIFYYPKQFRPNELQAIIVHEKAHARGLHSLDILLSEIALILQWYNPAIWYYKKAVKQNLEYLADAQTRDLVKDKKFYQYLLLQQAVGGHKLAVSNPFFNSFIKKRIVMMNKNQSKKQRMLKMFLVLPALVLFMVSFNTKEVAVPVTNGEAMATSNMNKSIELIIDKNTTNEELEKIKKNLAKDGVDFSYTTVRNDDKEIIDISMQISGQSSKGEKFSSSYQSNSEGAIKPISVLYDDEANLVSFGSGMHKEVSIHKSGNKTMVWSKSSDEGEHEDIIIENKNGVKKVIINGGEMTEDETQEIDLHVTVDVDGHDDDNDVNIHVQSDTDHNKRVKVKKHKSKDGEEIRIIRDSDEEDTVIESVGNDGSIFIETEGKDAPLYYIDGKKATKKEVKALTPDNIESITVLKGDKAIEKYGKKAKNGVVEITTKNKK
ncbi:M56 family metallopeptidase [Allomuricauda sp. SCSIO 65647]|uniref:M56 family metallopeptidase n=1 Tax=Allomuricauda sp. SCSIO 65647 TaxID=2908843 RepID=UPI001F29823A|nr:M56 family metallopeptidase [Muricauda sp. SCSIO 65647]UJH66740.1 TonB-dependent receptor plug domain-containing protein [Muricauda sp. SCSIO 65647]